ncbi:MAG: hypothetical protein MRJ92_04500 [Nitrospira sp.]|nr:hypothetical protein [Nitrospira sp.]
MTMLLPLSLTALLPCLRGLQRLAGQPALYQTDALLTGIRAMTGLDLVGLGDVLDFKRGIISPGPVEVRGCERYADNLAALTAVIDSNGMVTPR